MTPHDHEALLTDSLNLLHTLGRVHGAERALEMWETLGQVLGPGVKQEVFMMMLRGSSPTRVRIWRTGTQTTSAVSALRALRRATGWSLQDARSAWDRSAQGWVSIPCQSHDQGCNLRLELRDLGVEAV